jgi:hypothetical protein
MPSVFSAPQVLDAVTSGEAAPDYAELNVSGGGHDMTLLVFADALKVQGIRIAVSATLEQQIADALGCLLLTPRLADLVWLARARTLLPIPGDVVARTDRQESAAIDAALGDAPGPSQIVQTVGKHWVISNALLTHPGRAENYGWHFPGATWGGQSWESAVTPGLRVVQGQGWAHDPTHLDYSQTCVLVHRACRVDGADRDLVDVLQDPALAPLISHEGPLRILRQPGVAQLACRLPSAPSQVMASAMPAAATGLCPTPPRPRLGFNWRPWVLGAGVVAGIGALWWAAGPSHAR